MVAGDPPHRWAKDRKHQRLNHFVSRTLFSSRAEPRTCNKRTASGDSKPEPPDQAVNRLQLPFFHATATFEALVIILDQPPMPIPVHTLPCLFECRGGDRGQQDPFQRLLGISRMLFPDADDPQGQGLLACSRLIAWWQECHLTKGKLSWVERP